MNIFSLTPTEVDYNLITDVDKIVTFKIKTLDSMLKLHIDKVIRQELKKDGLTLTGVINLPEEDELKSVYLGLIYSVYCKYGLSGWSGMKNDKGEEVQFKTEKEVASFAGEIVCASKESLSGLKQTWITELGSQIFSLNFLTKTEEKN